MTIPTLYVRAASKKEINYRLAAGLPVAGEQHMPNGATFIKLITDMPHGTVIKVYSKVIDGTPYAKAYGQWNAKLGRVK